MNATWDEIIGDIADRLSNGRPVLDEHIADPDEDTGIYSNEDDYYDRYETGQGSGDPEGGGLTFPVTDTLTGERFTITIRKQESERVTPQEALKTLMAAIPEEKQGDSIYYASNRLYEFIEYFTEYEFSDSHMVKDFTSEQDNGEESCPRRS